MIQPFLLLRTKTSHSPFSWISSQLVFEQEEGVWDVPELKSLRKNSLNQGSHTGPAKPLQVTFKLVVLNLWAHWTNQTGTHLPPYKTSLLRLIAISWGKKSLVHPLAPDEERWMKPDKDFRNPSISLFTCCLFLCLKPQKMSLINECILMLHVY